MATQPVQAALLDEQPGEDICQERSAHRERGGEVRRHILPPADASRVATLFAVLSDPTRLQVLHALLYAPGGELCVCNIASSLQRDDTTISHQLRILRNQHIVVMRKVGRTVYYRLVDDHVRQLLQMGMAHCQETAPDSGERVTGALA
ncbi:MAG TPA: metalloregulator ArsR/SmtB family transcription factor [Ktedonobacteraceae bacterium]